MIKLVESFVKFCEDESYDIGLCAECYERKRTGVENVVTTVCNVPHLVVWAKMDSYPYWPAKIVAVKKKRVEIIFFGQHDTASIKYTKCRLFSEHSPNSKLESNYEKEFRASYMVCTIVLQMLPEDIDEFNNLFSGSASVHPECEEQIWLVSFSYNAGKILCKEIERTKNYDHSIDSK